MNVIYEFKEKTSLTSFAEKHDLTLKVVERDKEFEKENALFFALFEDVGVKTEHGVIGLYGNGNTPEEAIRAYTEAISEKRLIVRSISSPHREIQAPVLFYP